MLLNSISFQFKTTALRDEYFFLLLLSFFLMYGPKIRMMRELQGFSQDYLATKLGMTQASYSRIENNQTKLSTDILEKIAKELGVSPADLMSTKPAVINFYGTNHGTQFTFGTIGHFDAGQKEMYEKIVASKDEEISRLNKIIEGFLQKR
jgi:transcriptional regulator with XRE-family HTH domain